MQSFGQTLDIDKVLNLHIHIHIPCAEYNIPLALKFHKSGLQKNCLKSTQESDDGKTSKNTAIFSAMERRVNSVALITPGQLSGNFPDWDVTLTQGSAPPLC